ncbi:pPR-type GPCR protein, partial [Blyttiomyces helicus]
VSFTETPSWAADNQFITAGYRRTTYSYLGCIRSLSFLHNETMNILTHGFGALMFIGICWMGVGGDGWAVAPFYVGAVTCLGLSTTFHLCSCHSQRVSVMWNLCDYVGIVTLIVGSLIPSVYYGFYCHPTLQTIYLTIISVLGIATIGVTVSPQFTGPEYRSLRTTLFILLGGSGVFPLLHANFLYGPTVARNALSSVHMIITGLTYVTGALIYAWRLPERLAPGRFNIFGHSHQVFHCFVVAAALVHHHGV